MDYKKILEGIVKIINTTEKSDIGFVNICDYINENCPEFSESEDERIRKELIDAIQGLWDNDALPLPLTIKRKNEWIDWLENQDEKKLKWCVEDKAIIEDIIGYFQSERNLTTDEEYIMELDKYCELLQRVKEYFE